MTNFWLIAIIKINFYFYNIKVTEKNRNVSVFIAILWSDCIIIYTILLIFLLLNS